MRKLTLAAVMLAFLTGCATSSTMSADYVAQMNADKRVWPPVVEGQAFPVQFLWDAN
jgi:outer membrane lipoprotein SlyB